MSTDPSRAAAAGAPAQSGLIVPIPEAETLIGPHRQRLDANDVLGVPAHVTVLFPFVPPDRIDAALLDRLANLFGDIPRFRYRFERTDWFGTDVLWLAPADPEPFLALTRLVWHAFPEHPPYLRAHADEIVAHLTVGHGHPVNVLRAAEAEVSPGLPIEGQAHAVTLLAQDDTGRWTTRGTFPLGSSPELTVPWPGGG